MAGITIDVQKLSPKAPSLKAGTKVSHLFSALCTIDFVNCILDLPGAGFFNTDKAYCWSTKNAPGIYLALFHSVSCKIQVIEPHHHLPANDGSVQVKRGLTNKRVVTPTTVLEEQEFVIEIGTLFEAFSAVF